MSSCEFLFTFASMRTFDLEHVSHLCSEVETMAFFNQAGIASEWALCTIAHFLSPRTQVKMDLNNVFQQPSPYGWRSALVRFHKWLTDEKWTAWLTERRCLCVATKKEFAFISWTTVKAMEKISIGCKILCFCVCFESRLIFSTHSGPSGVRPRNPRTCDRRKVLDGITFLQEAVDAAPTLKV